MVAEECADCGAYFASASDLMEHVREKHPGGDPAASLAQNPESHKAGFVCGLCGMRFRTPAALAKHNEQPHASTPARRPTPAPFA
jgi:Zinc finger, C2H2 type